MSEIEAEIRRQMLEQRDQALRNQPSPSEPAPGASPPAGAQPPPAPSFHALPPPAFPPAGSSYPPHYSQTPYPPSYPSQQPSPAALPPPQSSAPPKSPPRKGLLGGLGAVGVALAKFWGAIKGLLVGLKFLSMGKYLLTAGSMLVSILAWSALYGWRLGAGVVLLFFIHEMGHALAIKRLGYEVKSMVFVPFMGAFVSRERAGSATQAAHIAIMGPVAGMLAGLACASVYGMTGSLFWLVLGYYSFYMNLFNLSGIPFLDGGRIAPLIEPKVLLGGLIAIAIINYRCPVSWLMILFALPQITERWRWGVDPALKVSKQDQQNYTIAYFALALLMGFASLLSQDWISELMRRAGQSF